MKTESSFDVWEWSYSSVLGGRSISIPTKMQTFPLWCWFVPAIVEMIHVLDTVILLWGGFVLDYNNLWIMAVL